MLGDIDFVYDRRHIFCICQEAQILYMLGDIDFVYVRRHRFCIYQEAYNLYMLGGIDLASVSRTFRVNFVTVPIRGLFCFSFFFNTFECTL